MPELIKDGRKLVTVRKITDIQPIANADAIELAIVDGWQTVIKKGEFSIGEYCVYFEIDSFLPANDPKFAFLLKSGTKTDEVGVERIRLKSIRLRGEISQGLALPISQFESVLEEIDNFNGNHPDSYTSVARELLLEELEQTRDGIEQFLNVTKYERPSERNGGTGAGNAKTAGTFPVFIPKTDEDRLQNLYGKYSTNYKDVEFRPSLKLDGSSITVAYVTNPSFFLDKLDDVHVSFNEHTQEVETTDIPYPHDYGDAQGIVCSRNLALKYDPKAKFWMGVNNIDLMTRLKAYCDEYGRSIAIQGELMGEGIQGNREKFSKYEIFAFRIWDIDNQEFLDDADFIEVCEILQVSTVPQFPIIKPFEKYSTLKEFLEASEIKSINHPIAEGIVYKSVKKVELYGKLITLHFKVINNKFLLKCED